MRAEANAARRRGQAANPARMVLRGHAHSVTRHTWGRLAAQETGHGGLRPSTRLDGPVAKRSVAGVHSLAFRLQSVAACLARCPQMLRTGGAEVDRP